MQASADIFISILYYFVYVCAADKFCKKYLQISRINEKLFIFFGFSGLMLIDIMRKSYSVMGILAYFLNNALFIGLILLFFRKDIEKKILAASIFVTVTTLAGNFFASFFSCLVLIWKHTVGNIAVPFTNEWEDVFIACISLAMVILAVYWLSKHLGSVFYCKTGKWYVTLAVPLLAVTAVLDMANLGAGHGILVRSGGNMSLYYDELFSHVGFCVLTALSMFAAGVYVFGMDRLYLERGKSSQYHSQIAAYKMLEEQYSRLERLRHDMKNHVIAMQGLLKNSEYEKMEGYLRDMEDSADLGFEGEATGNRVVDVLLYQKRQMAERKNIVWECDVRIPKNCCINEFDLCVLFGNILDNAVEACERQQHDETLSNLRCNPRQFISIQAGAVKKCFLLEAKNSTDMEDKHETGFTDKENAKEHGIGLLNIRDVVRRYNGAMNIEVRDGIFTISVLVPLSNTSK